MKGNDVLENSRKNELNMLEPNVNIFQFDGERRFCIQQHDAYRPHYDFRLELDGVLKSWAVPKGPSTDIHERRLAIQIEDHPLSYLDFEGVIPEDVDHLGTVQVWDIGTYKNITEENGKLIDLNEAINEGHFRIEVEGLKVRGGFAMTKVNGKQGHWVLTKMDDYAAGAAKNPVRDLRRSAISGRELSEIRNDGLKPNNWRLRNKL